MTDRTPASPVEVLALPSYIDREWLDGEHPVSYGEGFEKMARCPKCEEWSPCRVRTLFEFALQAQDHTITKGGRFDGTAFLDGLSDDDVMYDYPVAASGERMDPVLFVRWDKLRAALEPTHD